jgi:hypothetical protein
MHSDHVGAIDFPTLGDLWDAWIERHCLIPDGFKRRQPFRQYDWQFWCTANHGRIREGVVFDPDDPPLNQAFVYRRTDVIAAQKTGKGPWAACIVALDAVGPSEFAGWARAGDVYRCEDHGCGCGWEYDYEPGEPMGMRHPSPLIQVLATSQDQVDNIWRPLTAMIRFQGSRLGKLLLPREEFIRIAGVNADDPELDRIDAVTSSARSRLGNPISRYVQDETGTYTPQNGMTDVASTMRRGAAGMSGRGFTTSNCWDPSQQSVAQKDFEAGMEDVFTFYRVPPAELDFSHRAQRRRLLEFVYDGSEHINLDSIMAECEQIMLERPAEAERFFGNRVVQGAGAWLADGLWAKAYAGAVAS